MNIKRFLINRTWKQLEEQRLKTLEAYVNIEILTCDKDAWFIWCNECIKYTRLNRRLLWLLNYQSNDTFQLKEVTKFNGILGTGMFEYEKIC